MTPTTTYTLFAEEPPPADQQQQPGFGPMFLPMMLGMLLLFWVIVVLPAGRRSRREQEQLLANLKQGAKVLTNAGIVAVIVSAKEGEDEVVIRSEDTRLRIKRNVIVQILGSDEAEAAKQ